MRQTGVCSVLQAYISIDLILFGTISQWSTRKEIEPCPENHYHKLFFLHYKTKTQRYRTSGVVRLAVKHQSKEREQTKKK